MAGGLIIALGKGKPKDKSMSSKDGDDDGDESPGVYDEYADDVFDAIKNDDRKAFATALRKCIENC